jgi:membrane-bound ClpP family serine protease
MRVKMFDFSTLAILLLLVALAFVVMEVFIPSGGMIAILALVAGVASVWCAKRAWWDSNPIAWWSYVAALLFLIPSALGGAFYVFPRTSLGRKFLLEGPSLDEVTAYIDEEVRLKQLVGRHGKTLTLMNPGGLVLVEGERMHCESEGMVLLEPDEDVVVAAVKGNRLVVRSAPHEPRAVELPFDKQEEKLAPREPDAETEVADGSPLDFDVPRT